MKANGKLKYLLSLGIVAMEGRGFEYPSDTELASDDRIYVTNKSRDYGERGVRITVLNKQSDYFGTFGHYGFNDGNLVSPSGITEDLNGLLHVTDDYTHSVTTFAKDGSFIRKWGNEGQSSGELNGPSRITTNKKGQLLISDTKNHRIQIFSETGEFISVFGNYGTEEGNFILPWGINVNKKGCIQIADWGNSRIQEFSPEGEYIRKYDCSDTEEGCLNHPSDVASDEDGYIYITDWGNECLKVLNPEGNLVYTSRGESTLSKWASEFLETNLEESKSRQEANLEDENIISKFTDPHSVSAHIEKYFWSPVAITIGHDEDIYITESNRHRIQIFTK